MSDSPIYDLATRLNGLIGEELVRQLEQTPGEVSPALLQAARQWVKDFGQDARTMLEKDETAQSASLRLLEHFREPDEPEPLPHREADSG